MSATLLLQKYEILETLQKGRIYSVYRGLNKESNQHVILKMTTSSHPTEKQIERLSQEYHLISLFDDEKIVQAFEFFQERGNWVLVLEDIEGKSLKEIISVEKLSLDTFFKIALGITQALKVVHEKGVIHKDIKPSNIIISPDEEIKLIDFSIAEKKSFSLSKEMTTGIEGTLEYISPEQAGRISKSLENSSDLYSLGITFYELLSGHLPFSFKDPLDLIYAHLAIEPDPLEKINPDIPPIISKIVQKLLDKDPDSRYQTAQGLFCDLDRAYKEYLVEKNTKVSFPLALKDLGAKIHPPKKLYGRDIALGKMKHILEGAEKPVPLIFISGYSGIGKSSLVEALSPEIAHNKMIFLEGKFEQLKKNLPYNGFTQALSRYIRSSLSFSKRDFEKIQQKWRVILGEYAFLVIDLIPEIEWVVGRIDKERKEIGLKEKNVRFQHLFLELFQSIAIEESPLVLFLDDLQWADIASLEWIDKMVPQLKNLFFIGTYRSNEIERGHPLTKTLLELKEKNIPLLEIALEALTAEDVYLYLKDTFLKEPSTKMVQIFLQKTGGNPFFMGQLLEHLHKLNLISFNTEKGFWEPDLEKIEELSLGEDVVELMLKKIESLPKKTQSILSISALLGVEGSIEALSRLTDFEENEIQDILEPALKMGLLYLFFKETKIDEQKSFFSFAHDKIQQAAYLLFGEEERQNLHLRMFRISKELSIQEKAYHVNRCNIDLLTEAEKKLAIAVNLDTARIAQASAAHADALILMESAENYAKQTLSWTNDFEELFSLYKELAKCHFHLIHLDEAERLFSYLIEKTKGNILLQASIYRLKIDLYSYQDRLDECLLEARRGLALFGITFPEKVSDGAILMAVLKVRFMTTFADLYALKPMEDPKAKAIAELLSATFTVALQRDQRLCLLMCAECIKLHLHFGYTKSLLGLFLAAFLFFVIRDFKRAKLYYDYVYFLHEKMGGAEDWAAVLGIGGAFVDHWFYPFSVNIEHLKQSSVLAHEKGTHFYTTGSDMFLNFAYFRTSMKISKMKSMKKHLLEELISEKRVLFIEVIKSISEGYLLLEGSPDFSEIRLTNALKNLENSKSQPLIQATNANQCFINYLMEQYDVAYSYALKAFPYRILNVCNITADQHDLFMYLIFNRKGGHFWEKRTIEKSLKAWAKQNPINYQGTYELVLASKYFHKKKFFKAFSYFDRALNFFQKKNWPLYVAITAEHAAEAYEAFGLKSIADFYLNEAVYYYGLWGATAKVRLIEKKLPEEEVKTGTLTLDAGRSLAKTTGSSSTSMIDLLSVIKASQTISEETQIQTLLGKIMELILENSGAQRAVILILQGNEFFIRGECYLQNEKTISEVYKKREKPLNSFTELPHYLIESVARSEEVILTSKRDELYESDPYFSEYKPKVALGMPVIHQGALLGVLYLEHFLNSHAFNQDIIQTLKLVTHQAAISLENADLYTSYKRFVPYEFLQHLKRRNLADIELGDQAEEEMTILFADIRGFTTISENLPPAEVFKLINEFLKFASPIIRKNGGFVDKYIGDAIMGIFPDKVDNAVFAALEILEKLSDFNEERHALQKTPLEIGIGINTGKVVLGVIGEEERLESSVFGDSVNIASRIESLNRVYDTKLLISGEAKQKLSEPKNFSIEYVDSVKLRGKNLPVEIWKVF